MKIDPPVKVSATLRKQEVTIADSSAAARLTLWGDKIGTLKADVCYHLKSMCINSFRNDCRGLRRVDIGEEAEDNLWCTT